MRLATLAAFLLFAACTGSAGPSAQSSSQPGATPTAGVTSTQSPLPTGSPKTSPSTNLQPSPTGPPPDPTFGAIAGHTSSAAEVLFPQLVYAISTAGASHGAYSTETVWSQSSYTIKGVRPGSYYVYTTNRPLHDLVGGRILGAAYDDAVKCGLDVSCTSHKPIPVTVKGGATTSAIDPIDWYIPDGRVPAPPPSIVPVHAATPPPANAYGSARAAAIAASMSPTTVVVGNIDSCPMNQACTAVGFEIDGTQAAYFVGASGSNADLIGCGTYVFHNASGWHGLIQSCQPGTVFPALGRRGRVSLPFDNLAAGDCANVRTAPKGKIVACLHDGTVVGVDKGPVWAPMASMDGMWWRIAGRGWMADDYLRYHLGP